MTNVIVRKIKDNAGNDITPDPVKGMKKAGDVINEYLSDAAKPRRALFKRLYKRLVEANGKFDFAVRDANGDEQTLTAVANANGQIKYRKFTANGNLYKIVTVIDDEESDADDDFFKMHIAVPATPQNLLADGYVGTMVSHIEGLYDAHIADICTNNTVNGNATEDVKKYLLASVFLSRCH